MLWSKIIGAGGAGGVVEGWNVSTAVFNQSFSVTAQDGGPSGPFFKPDGTKMYIVGDSTDRVYEYNLSTAWDISTAALLQSLNVASLGATIRNICFKPDGTKMYIMVQLADNVVEYSLSTAWDISTAVFLQSFNVSAKDTDPFGLFFRPDGIKMYVLGFSSDSVHEYTLATAWNVSTAAFFQSFSVAGQASVPTGLFFKPDGLKMYVVDNASDNVSEYNLGTAWNVSTAAFFQSFNVTARENSPFGLFFKFDGTKMYILGSVSSAVVEYDLG